MEKRNIETASANYTVYVNHVSRDRPLNVFLHGGPGFNCFAEREVMGPLLHETTNFVWFDHIGCAESPVRSAELLTWDRQVDDIVEVTKAVAGSEPVNFVGHCLGAPLTHGIVERDPSLVRRVVWYSPTIGLATVLKRVLDRSVSEGRLDEAALPEEERELLRQFLGTTLSAESPDREVPPEKASALLGLFAKIRDFHELYWLDKEKMASYLALMEKRPPAFDVLFAITLSFFARGGQDVPAYDGIPVLSLHSDNDGITPWESNGQALAEKIPHMEAKCIPGGYHWLQFEKTDEVCALTTEFLDRSSRAGARAVC